MDKTSNGKVTTYDRARQLIQFMKSNYPDIECVVFDMDYTITSMHSKGCLHRSALSNYLISVSWDVRVFIPILIDEGYKVAIATFIDDAYYLLGYDKEEYISGRELVEEILDTLVLTDEQRSSIYITSYQPRVQNKVGLWKPRMSLCGIVAVPPKNKNCHLYDISDHYNIENVKMLLIDDSSRNIKDANAAGVYTVYIPEFPKPGFSFDKFEFGIMMPYKL